MDFLSQVEFQEFVLHGQAVKRTVWPDGFKTIVLKIIH